LWRPRRREPDPAVLLLRRADEAGEEIVLRPEDAADQALVVEAGHARAIARVGVRHLEGEDLSGGVAQDAARGALPIDDRAGDQALAVDRAATVPWFCAVPAPGASKVVIVPPFARGNACEAADCASIWYPATAGS